MLLKETRCLKKRQLEGDAVRSWITGLWQWSYANLDLFCLKPVCSFNIPSPAVLTLGIHFSFLLAFRISQFYFKFELLLIFFWSRLLFFFFSTMAIHHSLKGGHIVLNILQRAVFNFTGLVWRFAVPFGVLIMWGERTNNPRECFYNKLQAVFSIQ